MKKLLIILIAIAGLSFAQNEPKTKINPDGFIGGWSLHITPILSWGNPYVQKFNCFPVSFVGKSNYGIDAKIDVPGTRWFTFSLGYKYRHLQGDYTYQLSQNTSKITDGLLSTLHEASFTLSFYFGAKE